MIDATIEAHQMRIVISLVHTLLDVTSETDRRQPVLSLIK